ncbi:hypothetical protein [Picrophilus oshimae]|uniref:Hypothetical membrane spanning protein n=1 Tax=Picrophilus torridus (strain ATCC 700027 / DSM 9790 / JCM 10055 / NBRC 100828 / KAW 2/3) TaxID=1122961 RepID=Q6L1K0_PICTO|nr:hypothetical protein [Picrophilus oshimae]AAT43152.1 hypothetical membrane spanning protein [Picrophilus oshimae DSM 9789]SMD30540.1 hypothetical protein SAMN02745355_0428 [Picrophilus oshimae DSM 9789]
MNQYIKKNRGLFSIIFSVLLGAGVFTLSIYVPYAVYLVILLPVFIFLIMHFLGLYKLRQRLLAGAIIIILITMIFGGIYTNYIYTLGGTEKANINGTEVETIIVPYSGYTGLHNITALTSYNGSLNNSYLEIISETSNCRFNITYNSSNAISIDGMRGMYYTVNLPRGLYYVVYKVNKNYYIDSVGPVNTSESSLYTYATYAILIKYLLIVIVLYLIGVFFASYIQRSAKRNDINKDR